MCLNNKKQLYNLLISLFKNNENKLCHAFLSSIVDKQLFFSPRDKPLCKFLVNQG